MGGLALVAALGALAAALAAVVIGRRWTRSLVCAQLAVASLAVALAASGAGALGWLVALASGTGLALLQVYGWMLVDVDRDHLPATEAGTRVARSLAFLLLGGGLVLLVAYAAEELAPGAGGAGPSAASVRRGPIVAADAVGEAFFGAIPATALVLGTALAAALLTSVLLLRTDDVAVGPSDAGVAPSEDAARMVSGGASARRDVDAPPAAPPIASDTADATRTTHATGTPPNHGSGGDGHG